jgi:MFS superfamily sulfate permease-like transporter
MELNDFLGITIVGIALSLIVQAIKQAWGNDSVTTKIVLVVLALVCGTGYYFIRQTVYYQTILLILGMASLFWAFFIKSDKANSDPIA